MNGFYLQDPTVVKELTTLWISYPPRTSFFGKLRRILKWYKTFCIQKAKDQRIEEINLKALVSQAQEALHANPSCDVVQSQLASALEKLQ